MLILQIVLSILLIIQSLLSFYYMRKCKKYKSLIDDVFYNIQRIEGKESHDNTRLNYCLHKLKKEISEDC